MGPEVEVCERVGVARAGRAEPQLLVVLDGQDGIGGCHGAPAVGRGVRRLPFARLRRAGFPVARALESRWIVDQRASRCPFSIRETSA